MVLPQTMAAINHAEATQTEFIGADSAPINATANGTKIQPNQISRTRKLVGSFRLPTLSLIRCQGPFMIR